MGPRVSEGQRETVLAFMEPHLQLALRSSELGPGFSLVDRRRLWQQLADVLNAEGPVVKTVDQWRKQQVYEARRDATAIAQEQISTGGGRAPGFRGRVLQLTGAVRFRGVTDLPYQEVLRRIEPSTTRLAIAAERTAAAQEGILEKRFNERHGIPCACSGGRSSKTFKPKKNIPEGTHQYDLMKQAAATLGSGNLRLAVMLPEGEDLNEWVAVNTVDFFNQINMLYGTVTEFCTEGSCAVMSAGPKYEYHWADGQTVKKPIKCSAPKYIDYLMTWVQDQLDDEALFPSKIVHPWVTRARVVVPRLRHGTGTPQAVVMQDHRSCRAMALSRVTVHGVPFPKNFFSIAKTILKRLFRVYAHIYHQHFSEVVQLGEEAHLNTSFKHFIFFVQEFGLIDRRELVPLQELIEKLTSKDRDSNPSR
ncbi:hypothetical protein HPB49_002287 [Dermacentor silvarum]|uniref:Uncharacterized protein n=1 Tax=Dermacentor silvarum TaxID=543639 RepID=A0ACB8DSZ3_DERSI|nr:hypothetical protein HPB49_002287 [Dermacentor silvarum]